MSKTNIDRPKKSISAEKFYEKIKGKQDFVLLDVRSKQVAEEWSLDFENIKTINYPYFKLTEKIPEELENKLDLDTEIIVVCTKGESSEMVTESLRSEGYNASSLATGTNGWSMVYKQRQIPKKNDNIKVYQYERPSSGCLAYMIISDDEAVVIDPLKQYSNTYIKDAESHDASIEYIIDTHIHADHISGFDSLSEQTDATKIMYKNAKERGVEYEFRTVEHGDTIKFGSDYLEVINTPGHTTDMTSYYIDNILFTGDSLFLDSIARPDLEDQDKAEDMAEVLYQTIKDMFNLPNNTIIAPGHKSGIHPLDTLNNTFTSELQDVKDNLDILDYNTDEFVNYILEDMPPRPANYESIIQINKGLKYVSESEEYQLELGPNNCSAS
jgi:glyoxylase-like metal-dependent hydrolase (beta-lactamase superfamily II)/rhodanese-related sulfurtransferase